MTGIELPSRYRYIRDLGCGGSGRVVLVHDAFLGKELALKLLHGAGGDAGNRERLQREFALLAEIEHPGLVRVHDFGHAGERAYYTSELIRGEPIGAGGRVEDANFLLQAAVDIAGAVAFLHESEILHLDIKPENILLCEEGGRRRPVLIDFGLFRRGALPTSGAGIEGSLPYLAPEYFSAGPIGPWTDVYALGVTLYSLATGVFPRPPPRLEAGGWVFDASSHPAPRPPSRVRTGLPRDLDGILLKSLAIDPKMRFPSAVELLEGLRRVQGSGGDRPSSPLPALQTVGREEELGCVDRFLDGLFRGTDAPFALLVTGPAGAGQTHLLREIKVRAQTRGIRFYLEPCYPGRVARTGALLCCLGEHLGRNTRERRRWESFLARLNQPRRAVRSETLDAEARARRAAEVALAAGAVREPLLLAVDGLQYWDEISIELLVDLLRSIGGRPPGERPPVAFVIGCREEGPCAALIRELVSQLLDSGASSGKCPSAGRPVRERDAGDVAVRGAVVTLRPLGLEETLALHRRIRGRDTPQASGLEVLQTTGGCPARIVALALSARGGPAAPGETPGTRQVARGGLDLPGQDARRLVLILQLLGRPASTSELASMARLSRAGAVRALRLLEREKLVVPAGAGGRAGGWLPGPAAVSMAIHAGEGECRSLRRRIGEQILRQISDSDDPRLLEALGHFQAARCTEMVLKHGPAAARLLKSTLQNRAALEVYRGVLELVPWRRLDARIRLALEMAEVQMRVGDLDGGIRMLKELLLGAKRVAGPSRVRLLLRLATLHARRGDFRRADSLFRTALPAAGRGRVAIERHELIYFLNEHAAVKALIGEPAEALRICGEGLRLAKGSRSIALREVTLNLHATRASVALRNFDHGEAIRAYETALEMAESIGSLGSQAVILNNLGTVYGQCERYREAIRFLREAEALCLRIDEGPSLVSIHGNLAVLHAKTGDFARMRHSIVELDRLRSGAIGKKHLFFLHHATGLSRICQGRYGDARRDLEEALRRGEELGDRHVVPVDEVYRAEALVFEGSYAEASGALAGLSSVETPARIRRMALARRALLAALLGQTEMVEECAAGCLQPGGGPVPFLEAWEGLFLAWAFSLGGHREKALGLLDPAERFFRRHGCLPAAALARCVRAEISILSGDAAGALKLLEGGIEHGNDLTAVIHPVLLARSLIGVQPAGTARTRCADLVAEASAALAGNPLGEWRARLEALHLAVRGGPAELEEERTHGRAQLAQGLDEPARQRYLKSPHWTAWTAGLPRASPGAGSPRLEGHAPGGLAGGASPRTASLPAPRPLRDRLVAKSSAMQPLVSTLDKLRGQDIPVLIEGETGTGKELVARIIHAESHRAARPFAILDCATIPPGLFEAELFGARAGAFTDQARDREGIIAAAGGGTVFIDEVTSVPLEAQAKLLRVLSARSVRALGAEAEVSVDVRFLFSTARDLAVEVREGRFRQDLFHRIHIVVLRVPPLRQRPEDLGGLVELLSAEAAEEAGIPGQEAPVFTPAALEALRLLSWPGNVRELRNLLLRLRLEGSGPITPAAMERALAGVKTATIFPRNLLVGSSLGKLRRSLERDYIVCHFRRLDGDTASLCSFLGLSSRQLYRRCVRLGIRLRQERRSLGSRTAHGEKR